MTPIGSTSSNIRRAIEFIVCSSCTRRAPRGHSRSLGRPPAAKLIGGGFPPAHRWPYFRVMRAQRLMTPAGLGAAASMLAAGVWLVISGASTYEAILLNGHPFALKATDRRLANTFQAGHSTSEIVG